MMIANDYNRNIYIHINLLDSIYRIYMYINWSFVCAYYMAVVYTPIAWPMNNE